MKTKLMANISAVGIALTLGIQMAHAAPFASGEIQFFADPSVLNPVSVSPEQIDNPPKLVTLNSVKVSFSSHSFAGFIPGTLVDNMGPVNLDQPFWDFTLWEIGNNYFESTSFSVKRILGENFEFLDIRGSGIAYLQGFEPTPGTWRMTLNSSIDKSSPGNWVRGSIVFGASTSAVPDGGTTVVLLGAALSALALGGRKLLCR